MTLGAERNERLRLQPSQFTLASPLDRSPLADLAAARNGAPVSFASMLQEWNHVIICLLLGVAALGFPLYDLYDIPEGPFAEL